MSVGRTPSSVPPANELDSPRENVARAQQAFIASASVSINSEWVELSSGSRIHYLEAGVSEPVIMLHGSGNSSSDWVPLMEQPIGRTYVAVDRPGYGLSDDIDFDPRHVRESSVEFLSELLDALGLQAADVIGSSGGSVIALWLAMDRPDRVKSLSLLGATPMLPGTVVPLPLRLMASSFGAFLSRMMPSPSPESVVKMMGVMGEAESIARYPELIDVYVAAGADSIKAEASGRELNAMIRGLRGYRPDLVFTDDELRQVSQPAILVWGDRDPIGSLKTASHVADLLADSELHVVAAGHAPWWGDPQNVAQLLSDFYRRLEGSSG